MDIRDKLSWTAMVLTLALAAACSGSMTEAKLKELNRAIEERDR